MIKLHKGFTLVELLIATAVFSVILLLVATGFIQIGRIYYKGVSGARTQEAARSVLESMTRDLQFTSGSVVCVDGVTNSCADSAPSGSICIGNHKYSYILGQKQALEYEEVSCTGAATAGAKELLPSNMQLIDLRIDCPAAQSAQVCKLHIIVAQGEDDMMSRDIDLTDGTPRQATCLSGNAGSQFCHVSSLTTTVTRRIK